MNSGYHLPVMLDECMEWLAIGPSGRYVDCTLGGGGHSDSGGDPDAGRRCESMYGMLVNHDRPGADESDSAHNLRGDATGVAHATKPML